MERLSFQVYVTDTLQIIAENTAIPAASLSKGEAGKAISRRWIERDKPAPPKDTRTAEEVIEHIRGKLTSI